MDKPPDLVGFKTTFDPLLRLELSAPQNANVSSLQHHHRAGDLSNEFPNFLSLLPLEQTLVHLDFHEVAGSKLLTYFFQHRLAQTRLSDADARSKFSRRCLAHDVSRYVHPSSPPVAVSVVFWTTSESANTPACEAGPDALPVFDSDSKSTGRDEGSPALSAHQFLALSRKWEAMPLGGFEHVDRCALDHLFRVSCGAQQHAGKVRLRTQGRLPALLFLCRSGLALATQSTTSAQHGQQIGCDFINGSITVNTVEDASRLVPRRKG